MQYQHNKNFFEELFATCINNIVMSCFELQVVAFERSNELQHKNLVISLRHIYGR